MELEEYIQYHETGLHSQPGFAYNTYLCTIPLDFPSVPMHWHEQMEIIYIKKGSGTVIVNSQVMSVSAGTIIPVLPGELHSIEGNGKERMEYENIIFSLSVLDSPDRDDWCHVNLIEPLMEGQLSFERPLVPGTSFHEDAAACFDQIDEICSDRAPGYSLLVKSCLFQFLHVLFRHSGKRPSERADKHHTVMKTVLEYVREHYSEKITVPEMAALVDYSPAYFMKLFREETGTSFISYLNRYRLQAACFLLKESEASVSDIAMRCGFMEFSYFIRSFRKEYGLSPGKYRSENRKKAVMEITAQPDGTHLSRSL